MKQAAKLAVVLALSSAGCARRDPKEREVERAVARAKAAVNRTAFDQVSAMSLASIMEQGGTIWDYVAANLDGKGAVSRCDAPGPFCLVIRSGAASGEYVIEGYGASPGKPIASETARARLPRRRSER